MPILIRGSGGSSDVTRYYLSQSDISHDGISGIVLNVPGLKSTSKLVNISLAVKYSSTSRWFNGICNYEDGDAIFCCIYQSSSYACAAYRATNITLNDGSLTFANTGVGLDTNILLSDQYSSDVGVTFSNFVEFIN